jgi:hypothetical protein
VEKEFPIRGKPFCFLDMEESEEFLQKVFQKMDQVNEERWPQDFEAIVDKLVGLEHTFRHWFHEDVVFLI